MIDNNDITQTGVGGLKGIRGADLYAKALQAAAFKLQLAVYDNDDLSKLYLESKLSIGRSKTGQVTGDAFLDPATYDYLHYDDNDPMSYFGSSIWDEPTTMQDNAQNMLDERANNLWGIALIAAGLAKGGITAVTTAVDGTIGALYGIGTGIYNEVTDAKNDDGSDKGFIQGLWDNDINKAIAKIQEDVEEWLPNYYTSYELEAPWYNNIFTANFLGDKVLKNAGFTIGALAAGAMAGGVGATMGKAVLLIGKGAMAEAKLAGAGFSTLKNIAKTNRIAGQVANLVTNTAISASGEASVEAINAVNEAYKTLDLNVEARRELLYSRLNPYDPLYNVKKLQIDNAIQEYKNQESGLLADAGNTVYGLNMAILSLSNLIEFRSLLSGGFNLTAKLSNIGLTVDGKKATSKEFGKAFLEGKKVGLENLHKVKPANVAWKTLRNAASEGWEESAQNLVSNTAKLYTSAELNRRIDEDPSLTLLGSRINPESNKQLADYGKSFMKVLNDNFGTIASPGWEEAFLGALTGAIGFWNPAHKKRYKDKEGNWELNDDGTLKLKWRPFSTGAWEGGIFGVLREENETSELNKSMIDLINARLHDKEFQERVKKIISDLTFSERMKNALANDDIMSFKDAEIGKLINDALYFRDRGALDTFKSLFEGFTNIDDKTLGLIYLSVNNKELEKQDTEKVRKQYEEKAKKTLDEIENIVDVYDFIDENYRTQTSLWKEEMTFLHIRLFNNNKRINQLEDKKAAEPDLFTKKDENDLLVLKERNTKLKELLKKWEEKPELLHLLLAGALIKAIEKKLSLDTDWLKKQLLNATTPKEVNAVIRMADDSLKENLFKELYNGTSPDTRALLMQQYFMNKAFGEIMKKLNKDYNAQDDNDEFINTWEKVLYQIFTADDMTFEDVIKKLEEILKSESLNFLVPKDASKEFKETFKDAETSVELRDIILKSIDSLKDALLLFGGWKKLDILNLAQANATKAKLTGSNSNNGSNGNTDSTGSTSTASGTGSLSSGNSQHKAIPKPANKNELDKLDELKKEYPNILQWLVDNDFSINDAYIYCFKYKIEGDKSKNEEDIIDIDDSLMTIITNFDGLVINGNKVETSNIDEALKLLNSIKNKLDNGVLATNGDIVLLYNNTDKLLKVLSYVSSISEEVANKVKSNKGSNNDDIIKTYNEIIDTLTPIRQKQKGNLARVLVDVLFGNINSSREILDKLIADEYLDRISKCKTFDDIDAVLREYLNRFKYAIDNKDFNSEEETLNKEISLKLLDKAEEIANLANSASEDLIKKLYNSTIDNFDENLKNVLTDTSSKGTKINDNSLDNIVTIINNLLEKEIELLKPIINTLDLFNDVSNLLDKIIDKHFKDYVGSYNNDVLANFIAHSISKLLLLNRVKLNHLNGLINSNNFNYLDSLINDYFKIDFSNLDLYINILDRLKSLWGDDNKLSLPENASFKDIYNQFSVSKIGPITETKSENPLPTLLNNELRGNTVSPMDTTELKDGNWVLKSEASMERFYGNGIFNSRTGMENAIAILETIDFYIKDIKDNKTPIYHMIDTSNKDKIIYTVAKLKDLPKVRGIAIPGVKFEDTTGELYIVLGCTGFDKGTSSETSFNNLYDEISKEAGSITNGLYVYGTNSTEDKSTRITNIGDGRLIKGSNKLVSITELLKDPKTNPNKLKIDDIAWLIIYGDGPRTTKGNINVYAASKGVPGRVYALIKMPSGVYYRAAVAGTTTLAPHYDSMPDNSKLKKLIDKTIDKIMSGNLDSVDIISLLNLIYFYNEDNTRPTKFFISYDTNSQGLKLVVIDYTSRKLGKNTLARLTIGLHTSEDFKNIINDSNNRIQVTTSMLIDNPEILAEAGVLMLQNVGCLSGRGATFNVAVDKSLTTGTTLNKKSPSSSKSNEIEIVFKGVNYKYQKDGTNYAWFDLSKSNDNRITDLDTIDKLEDIKSILNDPNIKPLIPTWIYTTPKGEQKNQSSKNTYYILPSGTVYKLTPNGNYDIATKEEIKGLNEWLKNKPEEIKDALKKFTESMEYKSIWIDYNELNDECEVFIKQKKKTLEWSSTDINKFNSLLEKRDELNLKYDLMIDNFLSSLNLTSDEINKKKKVLKKSIYNNHINNLNTIDIKPVIPKNSNITEQLEALNKTINFTSYNDYMVLLSAFNKLGITDHVNNVLITSLGYIFKSSQLSNRDNHSKSVKSKIYRYLEALNKVIVNKLEFLDLLKPFVDEDIISKEEYKKLGGKVEGQILPPLTPTYTPMKKEVYDKFKLRIDNFDSLTTLNGIRNELIKLDNSKEKGELLNFIEIAKKEYNQALEYQKKKLLLKGSTTIILSNKDYEIIKGCLELSLFTAVSDIYKDLLAMVIDRLRELIALLKDNFIIESNIHPEEPNEAYSLQKELITLKGNEGNTIIIYNDSKKDNSLPIAALNEILKLINHKDYSKLNDKTIIDIVTRLIKGELLNNIKIENKKEESISNDADFQQKLSIFAKKIEDKLYDDNVDDSIKDAIELYWQFLIANFTGEDKVIKEADNYQLSELINELGKLYKNKFSKAINMSSFDVKSISDLIENKKGC